VSITIVLTSISLKVKPSSSRNNLRNIRSRHGP
jgi:hypothetical protein